MGGNERGGAKEGGRSAGSEARQVASDQENSESHVERKRKNLDDRGEVSNSKRRMFGSK